MRETIRDIMPILGILFYLGGGALIVVGICGSPNMIGLGVLSIVLASVFGMIGQKL